jgi:hypothetical protein
MPDNEQFVRTRTLSWEEICQRTWGKDWNKPEVVYEFGQRKYESTDHTDSGIYERE